MAAWREEWIAALDALEADVEMIERLIEDEHRVQALPAANPWSPPTELGTLPLDLKPRADRILARQIAAAQAVSQAITGNRRQTAFAAKIEVGTAGKAIPTYVDCNA
ncbi:hypothetical protein [Actinoplanes sp. NPDC049118]|uniref:hypothetical protein n=1 Tax=Actinoplanes sp. NPDC049118 TaxID=3155769 RepID=UPI003400123B